MTNKKEQSYYLVTYKDPKDDKVMSLKCREIEDSNLGLGFVALSDFILKTTKLVVTPDEEALAKRLENTKVWHLSLYSILAIQEVGDEGDRLNLEKDRSNLLMMPNMPKGPTKEA